MGSNRVNFRTMRFEKATKNVTAAMICRLVEQLLAFISRTVFIHFLTVEYLGITSLFANVLNVLNLAELGLGTAISVSLYKPLANGDKESIKAYMCLYKRAYFFIGLSVLVIGSAIIPFLPYLMKGTTNLVNVNVVYFIYVINSALSYWLFAYKSTLLHADQKSYLVSYVSYGVACVWKVFQVIMLVVLRQTPDISFYVYCFADLLCNVTNNIIVSEYVNKKYPFILEKQSKKLNADEKKNLFKNVYGVSLYKLSATVNGSADSIIISSFIGTVALGLYSNYLYIAKAVITIVGKGFTSITAIIGNINVLDSDDKKNFAFNTLHLVSFWVYGFCTICLWILLNPFVTGIWLGEGYRLSEFVIFAMCLNYLVDGLMEAPVGFRNACGLYWQSRYRAILAVIVNVVLSIIAVKVGFGIAGILFATVISRLTVTLIIDTTLVHRLILHCPPSGYFRKYFFSLFLVLGTGGLIKLICMCMPETGVLYFVARVILCIVVPNIIWWFIFRRTEEFQYIIRKIKLILSKRISKLSK